jgi:16S rRNA processing protein RimM
MTLRAGRVGRAHGLDGSFYVEEAAGQLLAAGTKLFVGDAQTEVVRRAGTDDRPIVRVGLAADRGAAAALRGRELRVPREAAPALEDDEYWADDLVGCRVIAGERVLGTVRRLVALPSCEALDLDTDLLVPLVRDAIRRVDLEGRAIHADPEFLGAA